MSAFVDRYISWLLSPKTERGVAPRAAFSTETMPYRYRAPAPEYLRDTSECEGRVYVAQESRHEGLVKIGFSRKPNARLAHLSTASGRKLILLLLIPGGRALERELHRAFELGRLRGEWFWPTDELMAFVDEHASRFGPARLEVCS